VASSAGGRSRKGRHANLRGGEGVKANEYKRPCITGPHGTGDLRQGLIPPQAPCGRGEGGRRRPYGHLLGGSISLGEEEEERRRRGGGEEEEEERRHISSFVDLRCASIYGMDWTMSMSERSVASTLNTGA